MGFDADIGGIAVKTEEAIEVRMKHYLEAVGDPYRFCVGKTRVRVVFGRAGAPLEASLEKILMREI